VHVFTESIDELEMWIREEVAYPGIIRRGDRGMAPGRVQEWLTLHRFGLAIDGDFGPVTARQLRRFRRTRVCRAAARWTRPPTLMGRTGRASGRFGAGSGRWVSTLLRWNVVWIPRLRSCANRS
jgi:hypothetical protein